MNRLIKKDVSSSVNGDHDNDYFDGTNSYERQALIESNSNDDDIDLLSSNNDLNIRHRQHSERSSQAKGYELKNLSKNRDLISEHIVEVTYYDIQPGDTLQSICLRYACPVNQVKRLNGLMSDQDFYGLKRLKLPLGKLGLLEDLLKQQKHVEESANGIQNKRNIGAQTPPLRVSNSPGSAISTRDRYKPLLSPGYSSDRVDKLGRDALNHIPGDENAIGVQHNSYSFSSLRDFANNDININMNSGSVQSPVQPQHPASSSFIDFSLLPHKTFIKDNVNQDHLTADDLLFNSENVVHSVFEDLDYHVERAKEVAGTFDKRAAEIVNQIDINNVPYPPQPTTKVSKIPELFFSGENFGLNLKKLVLLIFVVCLVVPLVYMSSEL